ncbi:MAG: EAL domain-containing protein [Deltaproteobacteria bacterium]|nr:EAL domain-containing protein [Deltaproteobacteria bacterium]
MGFTLVLIVLGLETAVFFTWALPGRVGDLVSATLAVALTFTLFIPTAFRRYGSLALGAFLLNAASYLVIAVTFLVSGGIHSPLLHWLGLIPLVSALMGARRMAWGWAIIGLATMGVFIGSEAVGLHVPDYLDLTSVPEVLWAQRLIDVSAWVMILLSIALIYEGNTERQTAVLAAKNVELEQEIVQRSRAEAEIHHLAYYDELTGLPNRRLFMEQLERATSLAESRGWTTGVFFMDLDGFKVVNDTYGHGLGDELLKTVGERLQACIRASDSVARDGRDVTQMVSRRGGDEFTLLLVGLRNHREAATVARRIIERIEEPIQLGSQEVLISASIGIALHAGVVTDLDELLRNADLAMYSAKEHGKHTFKFFEASMNEDIARRANVTSELREAIAAGELVLHFQPIVAASDGSITGLETLVRWRHPRLGLLGPMEFIDIAEESGLIHDLGDWVLLETCSLYQKWRRDGIAPGRVAVNVSGVQLRRGRLVDTLERTLRTTGMDPCCLEVEITESAMMVDEDEASRCLAALHEMGIRIALDDFGTGYSSLSYVKRFPVDSLKIDRSFVGVEGDSEGRAISTAIIAMGHQLGLKIVAEGVETDVQRAFLRDQRCDELQGYLISRPLGVKDIEEFLTEQASE